MLEKYQNVLKVNFTPQETSVLERPYSQFLFIFISCVYQLLLATISTKLLPTCCRPFPLNTQLQYLLDQLEIFHKIFTMQQHFSKTHFRNHRFDFESIWSYVNRHIGNVTPNLLIKFNYGKTFFFPFSNFLTWYEVETCTGIAPSQMNLIDDAINLVMLLF